jgi:predicted nucleic acid-binding Zn ribbon protein
MFHDLRDVLMRRLRQQGIGSAVEAAQVVEALRSVVREMMGERAASELRKVALKDDTLEILTGSGVLAAELRMRESVVRDKLRERTGGQTYRMRIFG